MSEKYNELNDAFVNATKEAAEALAWDNEFKEEVKSLMKEKTKTAKQEEKSQQLISSANTSKHVAEALTSQLKLMAMADSMDVDKRVVLKMSGMDDEDIKLLLESKNDEQ